MASIGSAELLIVPKFDGLSGKVNSALSGVDTTPSGRKMGKGVSDGVTSGLGGLVKGGAIVGVFSSITSKAMDLISSHVGSAVSRLDTLNNYPKVMQSLGVDANEAQASIQTMSDRLSSLPTRLDDMAATTQGLYAATKDYGVSLTTATNAGLALNDMLLAGGQGTEVASSAMEQFRQMLSKGKPDMQDWKSLISAAPGQMDQLAKSMLGPTANANDLYAALGGGKNDPTISMSQLLDAIIQLDNEGGAGLASFKDQAEDATGGVQTAVDNLGNAFTKGIAKVMTTIGSENIVSGINTVKGAVNGLFDVTSNVIESSMDFAKYSDNGANAMSRITDAMQKASGPVDGVIDNFDTLGETVEHAMERAKKSEEKATESHHKYLDGLNETAKVVSEAYDAYSSQVSTLEYAGQVIDSYAGKTGLSSAQQRELKDAVDTVNSSCGTQYQVMEDGSSIIDANTGEVQDNTTEIWNNIKAREAAAKADFYMTSKLQADKDAANALNDFQDSKQSAQDYADAVQALIDKYGSLQKVKEKASEVHKDSLGQVYFTEEQKQAQAALGGLNGAVHAMREADVAQRQAAQSARELAAEQEALQAKASGAELSISQLAMTTDVAAQAFNEGGTKAQYSIEDFGSALEAAAADKDKLKDAMGDPDTMAEIVAAYDGTAESLGGVLDQLGIGFDETSAKAADAAGTVSQMGDWLAALGDDAYEAFALMGTSSDDLAGKLSAAGVSMEELSSLGADNFTKMAESCNGDVDSLINELTKINALGLDPKTLTVNDDGTITDETGKVWDLNAMTIDDKIFTVNDDGTISVEQAGVDHLSATDVASKSFDVTSNGTTQAETGNARDLRSKLDMVPGTYTAKVTTSGVADASSSVGGLLDKLSTLAGTAWTAVVHTVTGNASGGINLHASGGVRRHASGAIYTRPTYISPNDIIGEAGAEYYDGTHIVPLTNRRYSQPFADIIAEEVAGKMGRGNVVTQHVTNNFYERDDMYVAAEISSRALMRAAGV